MSDGFIIKRGGGPGGSKDYSAFKALVNKSITEVTANMLYGVTSIGDYTFSYCKSLASVTIPNSVTSIGNNAFSNCNSLASIEIPNSVTTIGSYAFSNCKSLASVTIPNSVTSIWGYAFQYCSSLASVTLEATTPPTLANSYGYYPFDECSALEAFYVPAESVDAYKAAPNWSHYVSKIQAIPSD